MLYAKIREIESNSCNILSIISKNELNTNILRHISPHFNFDINKIKI